MKKLIKLLPWLLVLWIGNSILIALFQKTEAGNEVCMDHTEVGVNYTDHQRSWSFITRDGDYCMHFRTEDDKNQLSADGRKRAIDKLTDPSNPWSELYGMLVKQGNEIDFLVDSLIYISQERGLSGLDLAELVVTFVQDIPYSFVVAGSCSEYETEGKPCIGNVRMGLLAPYEFIHSEMGDCDTRAVLIFAVLERMGFDPAIIISNEYAHAMIALNLPTAGDYILHQGRKYFFWETTAKGWMAGMLPPSFGNHNYWKIALVNEL